MLFDLYDNGYNVRKSVELGDYFYSWSTQTYSEKKFEDPETGEEFDFDGVFDQLQVTITSNIKSRKWDKWDNKTSTILRRGKKPIDVDSIKDFLLQLSDYSKSQGYDITLYFGNTSVPFTKEILQPGVSQLGYTYEVIKMWDPEYITIVIHRNTVYEKYLESYEAYISEFNLLPSHEQKKFTCLDCGNRDGVEYQMYMVNDDIWDKFGVGEDTVCFDCLENRIGRPLKKEDFSEYAHTPCNKNNKRLQSL